MIGSLGENNMLEFIEEVSLDSETKQLIKCVLEKPFHSRIGVWYNENIVGRCDRLVYNKILGKDRFWGVHWEMVWPSRNVIDRIFCWFGFHKYEVCHLRSARNVWFNKNILYCEQRPISFQVREVKNCAICGREIK